MAYNHLKKSELRAAYDSTTNKTNLSPHQFNRIECNEIQN